MSRRSHRRRERVLEQRHRDEARIDRQIESDVGFVVGWCARAVEGDAEYQKLLKETHDDLIASMGSRRTGGVTWSVYGPEPGRKLLAEVSDGAAPLQRSYYDLLSEKLRDEGGVLILATAPGRP